MKNKELMNKFLEKNFLLKICIELGIYPKNKLTSKHVSIKDLKEAIHDHSLKLNDYLQQYNNKEYLKKKGDK